MAYFYFKPQYRNQSSLSYLQGKIVEELERSVVIKCIPNGVFKCDKDTIKIPKSALKECVDNDQKDNFEIESWVKFSGIAFKVFQASVFNI